MQGRPTGPTIGNSILLFVFKEMKQTFLNVLLKHMMGHLKQSIRNKEVSEIKRQQPLVEYTHCQNPILNLTLSFACKMSL